jgi:hypothetical protein
MIAATGKTRDWSELNADLVSLRGFEERPKKDCIGFGTYPTYFTIHIENYASSIYKSLPAPTDRLNFCALSWVTLSSGTAQTLIPSPTFLRVLRHATHDAQHFDPNYSMFMSESPAWTASPLTPPAMEDCTARIVSASSTPGIPKHARC